MVNNIMSIRSSDNSSERSETPTDQRINYIKSILANYTKIIRPMTDYDNMTTITAIDHNMNKKLVDIKTFFNDLDISLIYLKSGSTGHAFKAVSKDKKIKLAVKVAAYSLTGFGSVNNMNRPENAELRMVKLLSSFVVNKKTPHFVLPVCTAYTCMADFIALTKGLNIPIQKDSKNSKEPKPTTFGKFLQSYHAGKFDILASVFMGEWCDGGDLAAFLTANYMHMNLLDWKTIMFQIIFTLAKVHEKYPTFRHNDMKANNILVNVTDDMKVFPSYMNQYVLKPHVFNVPVSRISIKIWDFDFASIEGIIDNDKSASVWAEEHYISTKQNRYYDLHYFLNTLSTFKFFEQFYKGGAPQEIIDFVHRVIPEKYRKDPNYVSDTARLKVNKEYLTPYQILVKDPLFAEFRQHA